MEYTKNAADNFWSYSWSVGDKPVVRFKNTRAKTNVIYCADQLESVLKCSDEENSFIPVPRRVMENAYSMINNQTSSAA